MKSIQVSPKIKKRLAKFGIKTSTWGSILNELMDHADGCDLFWSDRN